MSDNIQQQKAVDGVAGLKKHDIKTSGVVFLIYCLVAAGAFGIEEMIPEAGPGMTIILLVVFPIIWAWPISNICAEMGSVLPAEGGVYIWGQEAYGEFWGYQLGWYNTMSIYITNGVYVALVVGYVRQFIPMSDTMAFVLKVLMIVIFTVINLLGIREVSKASTVFSVLIVLAFALVAVVGLINWNQNPMEPMLPPDYNYLDGISGGICIAVWMYCGYECISTVAGEVKNPQVIPKGLLIAMPLIALTYVLPTLGGLASVGNWENWSTDGGFDGSTVGYATVLTQYLGPVWGYIFLFIAIISQCAIFNTYLASGSRGFFVMADDYLFPKALVKNSAVNGIECCPELLNDHLCQNLVGEVLVVSQPRRRFFTILRENIQRKNGMSLIAIRCSGSVRTAQPFFLGSQNSEGFPADFTGFAGALHTHHALVVFRCPKVVVELNRGFHCLVLSAGAEQRKDKTYKKPHDSEQNPKPIKQKLQCRNSVHAA